MAASTSRTLFSRETRVAVQVQAPPERIWQLLTDAARYPQWTATVIRIDGVIEADGRIQLVSALDPKRVFRLRVKTWAPPHTLVWGDGMGTRTFALTPARGGTQVTVTERIGGPLFPLFARMIPSFDAAFDAFAADLKRAAEATPEPTA